MGGDLTGTLPNPQVDVNGLDGVAKRTAGHLELSTAAPATLLTVPGRLLVVAVCQPQADLVGLRVRLHNDTQSTLRVVRTDSDESSDTVTTVGIAVPAGTYDEQQFAASPMGAFARSVRYAVMDGSGTVVEVDALTNTVDDPCVVSGSAVS